MKYFTILLLCVYILCLAGCEKKRHEIEQAIVKSVGSSLKKISDDAEFRSVKERYKKGLHRPENCFDDPKVIALCHAIIREEVAKMEQLITKGADVNAIGKIKKVGKYEFSLLVYAFPFGENVLRCLLQHGADPNIKNNVRNNVFNVVIGYKLDNDDPRYKNYLKLLLEYGANPESDENYSPLIEAASHAPAHESELGKPFSCLVTLVESGTDLNRETEGCYAVTEAAKNSCYNNLLYLLESGAAYDTKTIPGSELQRILYRRYGDYQKSKKQCWGNREKVIQWLEEHGVSFDKPVPPSESTQKPEPFRVTKPKWLNRE
jgi:ankyrin repeat protein